ncbi:MAG: glycosyltransferase family 39 protein [Nitrospiraceae bacterium]
MGGERADYPDTKLLTGAVLSPMSQDRRYDLIAIASCLFVGILGLWVGASREVGNWGVEADFFSRDVEQTSRILAGEPYTNRHYPPGYAYLLALSSRFTSDLFVAGKILTSLSAVLFGVVTYRLLSSLWGKRLALAATLLVLLTLVPYTFLASVDMPANLALVLSMWLLLRRETSLGLCLQAGLAAGAAYLLRYNALFLLAGIPLVLLTVADPAEPWRSRLTKVGWFLGAALAVMAPWLLVNWYRNGSPFASDLYQQVAARFYHPQKDAFVWATDEMGKKFNSAWEVLFYDPWRFTKTFLKDVVYGKAHRLAWRVLEFPSILFAGAGLLLYVHHLNRRRAAFLILCLAGYLLHGLAGFAVRFYFFLFPLLFLAVVLPVFQWERLPSPWSGGRVEWAAGWWIFGILALASGYHAYVSTTWLLQTQPTYLMEAATEVRSRAVAGDRMMAIEPHLSYLSKLPFRSGAVANSLDRYVEIVAAEGIRFLVYSKHEEEYWPGLRVLSQPDHMPKSLQVIYEHKPSGTIIYEVVPPRPD